MDTLLLPLSTHPPSLPSVCSTPPCCASLNSRQHHPLAPPPAPSRRHDKLHTPPPAQSGMPDLHASTTLDLQGLSPSSSSSLPSFRCSSLSSSSMRLPPRSRALLLLVLGDGHDLSAARPPRRPAATTEHIGDGVDQADMLTTGARGGSEGGAAVADASAGAADGPVVAGCTRGRRQQPAVHLLPQRVLGALLPPAVPGSDRRQAAARHLCNGRRRGEG